MERVCDPHTLHELRQGQGAKRQARQNLFQFAPLLGSGYPPKVFIAHHIPDNPVTKTTVRHHFV